MPAMPSPINLPTGMYMPGKSTSFANCWKEPAPEAKPLPGIEPEEQQKQFFRGAFAFHGQNHPCATIIINRIAITILICRIYRPD
jgi:hypothetical protein